MIAERGERIVCADCGTLLHGTITTDGDGNLVQRVVPCPRCRLRIHRAPSPEPVRERRPRGTGPGSNNPPVRRNDAGAVVCVVCGTPLEYRGRGRPPAYCANHKRKAVA